MGETTASYLPLSPSFSPPLSASLGSQLFRYRLFTMDNEPPTADETQQEIPPFSPEQLVWIDRLIANRQGQSVATSSPGTANPVVDPASSAPAWTSFALTTSVSQPGEFTNTLGWRGLSAACCCHAEGRVPSIFRPSLA